MNEIVLSNVPTVRTVYLPTRTPVLNQELRDQERNASEHGSRIRSLASIAIAQRRGNARVLIRLCHLPLSRTRKPSESFDARHCSAKFVFRALGNAGRVVFKKNKRNIKTTLFILRLFFFFNFEHKSISTYDVHYFLLEDTILSHVRDFKEKTFPRPFVIRRSRLCRVIMHGVYYYSLSYRNIEYNVFCTHRQYATTSLI